MQLDRRTFLGSAAALAGYPTPLIPSSQHWLRPEDFGARGDGRTNDTQAFAALSDEVNRRGGASISLGHGRTYVVGRQDKGGEFAWTPSPVLALNGLTEPLTIIGNGARLICQSGLRFGAFDTGTNLPVERKLPNYDVSTLASPYRALIHIRACKAPISISDLELDGNLARLQIGGRHGDTGWQVPGTGLLLEGNLASETVSNVHSHHHGQDGVMIIGDDERLARSRFSRVIAEYNGRQGLSLTGGRGYDFEDCEFSRSGRSSIASAPGAGVDIEAEVGTIRDVSFSRCKFVDNSGAGMVADSGDSADVRFSDCEFVGTTNWSAWPGKPAFLFERCAFVGAVVHAFNSKDPALATRFLKSRFTDDPSLSPNGRVFLGNGPIVNLAESENVLFDGCAFVLTNDGVLPWSWRATYRDCVMKQAVRAAAQTKGRYLGRTVIDGPVDLYGSMIEGSVILNNVAVPKGPVGVDPW